MGSTTAQTSRWQVIGGLKLNITLRITPEFIAAAKAQEYTVPQMIDYLDEVAADTIHRFMVVDTWLKAGVINPEEAGMGAALDLPGEPVVTVWASDVFTIHSDTNPVHAFIAAYAAHKNATRYDTTPTQPPVRQSAPAASVPEPERSESGTEHLGKFDTRQDYSDYDNCIVSFEVAQIAREFSRKGDVCWKFYPEINGKAGQYPIHGMTTYSDNDKVPEPVREFLDKIEGEVFGPWRVVVYVAAKEDGKVNYYIKKIERVQVQHPF